MFVICSFAITAWTDLPAKVYLTQIHIGRFFVLTARNRQLQFGQGSLVYLVMIAIIL